MKLKLAKCFSSSFITIWCWEMDCQSIGVARIFDFWLGGPKSSKSRLSSPKLRVNIGPKSEIRTIFPPKLRWFPKKKKKVFTEIKSDFSAEIGNSNNFSAQNQVISKKTKKKTKKRSSPKLREVFRPKPLALLLNYCYVRNYWKKTATKHRRAMLS